MRYRVPVFLLLTAGSMLTGLFSGCGPQQQDAYVLKVGILASSSGPSSRWGSTTLECAQATADYWNELGGFEIDGQAYIIELVHADYNSDAQHAMRLVSELIHEHDVRYMIGPLTDEAVAAVVPLLDAAGVAYIHYGFDPDLVRQDSLGLLGMPIPVQTLPAIYDYLTQDKSVSSVCVLATDSPHAMSQKIMAERIAEQYHVQPLRYSTFDVSEENFDAHLPPNQLVRRMSGLQRVQPDAVLLCGLGPEEVPQALYYIRQTGFNGPIVCLNSQEPALLRGVGDLADGLIFVGGYLSEVDRSDYYVDLRNRVLDRVDEWQAEADVKLYALDTLLRLIRSAGPVAIADAGALYDLLDSTVELKDPFFDSSKTLRFVGKDIFSANRQISMPILLSEMKSGAVQTVYSSELTN